MPATAPEKIRDAERSRDAILAAAERCFAEHGYEGASLNEIAAEAGLSRGTPSYFFGSKERLYLEVVERSFAAREEATRAAFEPVHRWCAGAGGVADLAGAGGVADLREVLTIATQDYMGFLARRPSFVKLIMREELDGGAAVRSRKAKSTAMEDAFAALQSAGQRRGLRSFAVEDAVLLFVALTFAPASYPNTLMRAVRRDLGKPGQRRQQVELAVSALLHLIAG